MNVHLISSGPIDQTSGGFLYNRYILDYLAAAGHAVCYHDSPAELQGIGERDFVVVDSLVLAGIAQTLLSLRARLVLLLHVAPDLSACAAETYERLFARSLVVVTGNDTLRRLEALFGDTCTCAVRVEPGVPVEWEEKTQYSATASKLLCVANYIDSKGHAALFRCLDELRDLDWRLTLFGNAELEIGCYERFKSDVGRHEWADRVSIRREISHAAVNQQMMASDLLIHLSKKESYSTVVAEAIAVGLPVFARRAGNHEEFSSSGVVSYIDRPDSEQARAALRALLEEPSAYGRLRRNSSWKRRTWSDVGRDFARALEQHSWN